MKIKKLLKIKNTNVKSRIIPIGLSLFSIGFIGYILIGVFIHYLSI